MSGSVLGTMCCAQRRALHRAATRQLRHSYSHNGWLRTAVLGASSRYVNDREWEQYLLSSLWDSHNVRHQLLQLGPSVEGMSPLFRSR